MINNIFLFYLFELNFFFKSTKVKDEIIPVNVLVFPSCKEQDKNLNGTNKQFEYTSLEFYTFLFFMNIYIFRQGQYSELFPSLQYK